MQPLTEQQIHLFQEAVWTHGKELYRDMPWRQNTDPYWVLVSEIMLQQTQVDRVVPKFQAFIERFASIADLAAAPLADVLQLWSGLGYNRRAKFLHEAAKMICTDFKGVFPHTQIDLVRLPGVGVNTAGAIMAYSFNEAVVYIETNVRTVYFHHFFADDEAVSDTAIREYAEQTMDTEHPREWYWAVMDYGSFLKRQGAGANSRSRHYKKQSPLKGSVREVRGQILKELTTTGAGSLAALGVRYVDDERLPRALEGLQSDKLIIIEGDTVQLAR